jgi:hypothetical protein
MLSLCQGERRDSTNLINSVHVGAQATMYTKHPAIHHSSKRQVVEYLAAVSPNICAAIFSLAFVIEAVHLGYLTRLVVSSYQRYPVGVPHFERQEKQKCLNGVEATVNKVTCRDYEDMKGAETNRHSPMNK